MAIKFSPFRRLMQILSGNYMESGIIQHAPTGCGAPEASHRPWALLPGSGLQGNFLGFDEASVPSATGLLQGTESIAFGCANAVQQDTMTVADCDNAPLLITGGGFCPSAALLAKKQTIINAPASIFSGLTKRYVQAMYGSERFDMSNNEGQFRYPKLEISAMNPSGNGVPTTLIRAGYPNYEFVARSAQYDYFFVSKSGSTLTLFPMGFSSTGIEILSKLRDGLIGGASADQAESYALAYSKPDIDNPLAVISITGVTPAGEPLAYTWHGNTSGTAHTIVLHDELPAESMYVAREFELLLTLTPVSEGYPGAFGYNGRWYTASASIGQVGADKKWNPKDQRVWGHDYNWGTLYWLSGGWVFDPGTKTDNQTPIYAYYVGDNKVVHRITNTVGYTAGGTVDNSVVTGCGSGSIHPVYTVTSSAGYAGTAGMVDLVGERYGGRDSHIVTATAGVEGEMFLDYSALSDPFPENCATTNSSAMVYACDGSLPTKGEMVDGDLCTSEIVEETNPCPESPIGYDRLNRRKSLWLSQSTVTAVSVQETSATSGAGGFAFVPFQASDALCYGLLKSKTIGTRTTADYSSKTTYMSAGWDWHYFASWGYCYPPLPYFGGDITITTQFQWDGSGLTSTTSTNENNVSEIGHEIKCAIQGNYVSILSGADVPVWLDTLLNTPSSENFKLIQNPGNAITSLSGDYSIEFVAGDIVQVNSNFGATGIGGIGWK